MMQNQGTLAKQRQRLLEQKATLGGQLNVLIAQAEVRLRSGPVGSVLARHYDSPILTGL